MKQSVSKILLALITAFVLQGCAIGLVKSLHDVSYLEQVPVPQGARAKEVKKEVSQTVILGFLGETEFADKGWNAFQKTCPNGTILNPFVRYSTDLGFFAYKHKILFTGTCVEGVELE